jgi:hypothetical protein
MNHIELETKVYEEVSYARSPEERRNQIPSILKTLRTTEMSSWMRQHDIN